MLTDPILTSRMIALCHAASHVYACWTEWGAQAPSQRKAQVRATHFPGKDSVQLRLRSQDNPICTPEESVSSSIWCVY